MLKYSIFKQARLNKGLTQLQVADELGISEATVSRWEAGKTEFIPLGKAGKLSRMLDVPIDLLAGEQDDSSIPPICWELLGHGVLDMTRLLKLLNYETQLVNGTVVISDKYGQRPELKYSREEFLRYCRKGDAEGLLREAHGLRGRVTYSPEDRALYERVCDVDQQLRGILEELLTYGEGRTNVYQNIYDAQRKKEVHQGEDQGGA